MDERTKLQIILNSYTCKILRYYMEHKDLPSIAELQEMQRQTLDEPPPTISQRLRPRPRMRAPQ